MTWKLTRFDFFLLALSLILLIATLWNSVRLTFDSHLYVEGADYLRKNGFSSIFTCRAFLSKPPLYPLTIAFFGGKIFWIKIFNIACFAGIIISGFSIIERIIKEPFLNKFLKFHWAFATPLFLVHQFVWSEPPFILILNVYFLFVLRANRSSNRSWLVATMILGVLLIGFRHVGIFFVFAASVHLWFFAKKKYDSLFIFSIPIILFLGWQFLVWQMAENRGALDHADQLDLVLNLKLILSGLGVWMAPKWHGAEVVLSLIVVILLVFQMGKIGKIPLSIQFLAINIVIYLLVMITKGDLMESDIERYFSVIYLPVFIVGVYFIQFYSQHNLHYFKWIKILMIIWSIYPVVRLVKNTLFWM